jgi:hypothetical protein
MMLKTQSHSLPPAKQFLMNCNDVEGSDPSPLVKLKTQTLSTGEAAPTGSVPHSEPIVSTVRHVTGNDQDYLRKIPRVVVQKSALL